MSENLTIDEILRQAEEIRKKTARKAEAAIDKIHATQTPLEPQPKEPTVTAAPGVDDKTRVTAPVTDKTQVRPAVDDKTRVGTPVNPAAPSATAKTTAVPPVGDKTRPVRLTEKTGVVPNLGGKRSFFGTTGSETSLQIDPALIRCQTCVSAYIGAAFLCSGTVTDPQKEYNLEFLTARTNLARDFEALLAEHEFAPHRTRRNGVNLVYVKNSANLERLLRFMGAAGAAEEIHAQKAFKQVRNQTNRQTNCDTANLGKTARANAQTLRAIRYLQENDALETLPEVLQQAAAVRLQYPDLSLTALCGCFDPAVSKSGLSHRMKKLEALADALRQRVEKGQEAEP